jgi:hypothetical protein
MAGDYYLALLDREDRTWRFSSSGSDLATADFALGDLDADNDEIRIVTVTVTVQPTESEGTSLLAPFTASDLPLDPEHERVGSPDSLFAYFAQKPASRTCPYQPDWFSKEDVDALGTGVDVLHLFSTPMPACAGRSRIPTPSPTSKAFRSSSATATTASG